MGYHPQMIDSGRFTNDSMGRYVGKQTVKKIIAAHKSPNESRVLIMGMTFKEDVTDIRNSKVIDIVDELRDFSLAVEVIDPGASPEEVRHEYGITLKSKPSGKYDAVIVAVPHKEYKDLDENYFRSLLNDSGILVDLKGLYRGKIKSLTYWSL
jgi:UDP-N-acetyl-D-galactosamine dehydrogenase